MGLDTVSSSKSRRGAFKATAVIRLTLSLGFALYSAYLLKSFGYWEQDSSKSDAHQRLATGGGSVRFSAQSVVGLDGKPVSAPATNAQPASGKKPSPAKPMQAAAAPSKSLAAKPAAKTAGGSSSSSSSSSYVSCFNRDGNASRLVTRVCYLFNACVDTTADTSTHKTKFHRVMMFSGDDSNSEASGCVPAEGVPGGRVCSDQQLAYSGSLNHASYIMRARVDRGKIPIGKAQWLEDASATMLISRHDTASATHSLADDIWPLWRLAKGELGWDPLTGKVAATASEGGGPVSLRAAWLDWDLLGTQPWLRDMYARLLPGIPLTAASDVAGGDIVKNRARSLICSRGPMVVGLGDLGMVRNAHASFGKHRTFGHTAQDWAGTMADFRAFRDRYREAYKLPPLTSVPLAGTTGDVSRGIIIVDSAAEGGSSKKIRSVGNIGAIETAVRGVVGGSRPVQVRDWASFSAGDNAAAVDGADVIIALHSSAGGAHMMASRPGTVWLELLPPRASPLAGVYRGQAQRLGLRYAMQTVSEAKCDPEAHFLQQDAPFAADAASVAAHVQSLLGLSNSGGNSRNGEGGGSNGKGGGGVARVLSLLPAKEASAHPKLWEAVKGLTSRPTAWEDPADGDEVGGALRAVTACINGVRRLSPPLAGGDGGRCGSVVVLHPQSGRGRFGHLSDVMTALVRAIAADVRENAKAVLLPVTGTSALGEPGSVVGEERKVQAIDTGSAALSDAAAVAALLTSVREAELIIAPHGSGASALLSVATPGTHWIDLVPPSAHALHHEYGAAADAAGVRLHTLMLTEADCTAAAADVSGGAYGVDEMALAGVVALALRSEL